MCIYSKKSHSNRQSFKLEIHTIITILYTILVYLAILLQVLSQGNVGSIKSQTKLIHVQASYGGTKAVKNIS